MVSEPPLPPPCQPALDPGFHHEKEIFTAQKSLSLWSFVTQAVFSGTPGVGSRGPGDTGEAGGSDPQPHPGSQGDSASTSGLAHGPRGRDYTEKMLQDGGTSELGLTKSLEPVSMAAPGSEEKDTADGVTGPL